MILVTVLLLVKEARGSRRVVREGKKRTTGGRNADGIDRMVA